MRRYFYSFLFMSCLSSSAAFAEDIPVTGIIKSATVYSDRATLTRHAVVNVPAGSHTLVFSDLPLGIFTDSLRTEGKAQGKVTFGAISNKMVSAADYVAPRERALRARLQELEDQKRAYQDDKNAVQSAQKFLDNLSTQASLREGEEIASLNLKPEEWKNAADSIYAKTLENMKAVAAIDVAMRKTDEEIRQVNDDLRQLQTGQKQTYMVQIPFEAESDTTLNVDLSYQIGNVGWSPVYDARLDVKTAKVELVQYGSVWQRTGEDWTGVDLTLSTAQPSRGAGLPDLYTNWVNIFENNVGVAAYNMVGAAAPAAPMMKARSAEMSLDGAMMDSASMLEAAPEDKAVEMVAAVIDAQGFVGEYHITGPSTVKADGTQSKVLVGTFETESEIKVQVKPQLSTEAFLVSETVLKSEAPILPGQVNLFRDGAYIGQSNLPMLRQGDKQVLAFGVDDSVRVKRNMTKDERSEAGMITKDSVLERNFTTDIQNLHKEKMKIEVLETVPVAQNDRIRVEILKDKTTQGYVADKDKIQGLMSWGFELEPSGKQSVDLGWKVSWPKDQSISGL